MALVTVTVRRAVVPGVRGKNYSSETQGINTDAVETFIPSVSKKDGVVDGLVQTLIVLKEGGKPKKLWVTETVSTIAALDNA